VAYKSGILTPQAALAALPGDLAAFSSSNGVLTIGAVAVPATVTSIATAGTYILTTADAGSVHAFSMSGTDVADVAVPALDATTTGAIFTKAP
jgi:hypothetical protein